MHIQKTGGTSLGNMLRRRFAPDVCYPDAFEDQRPARRYPDLTPEVVDLAALSAEQRRSIRLLSGHFPLVAQELLSEPPLLLTVLRHPVRRTVSQLRHAQRYVPEFRDKSLAELFDLKRERALLMSNIQTRVLSFDSLEESFRVDDPVQPDRTRLETAKTNLQSFDFVGITEEFEASVRLCEQSLGWDLGRTRSDNAAPTQAPDDPDLERRILPEVQLDMELYEFARHRFREAVERLPRESRIERWKKRLLGR